MNKNLLITSLFIASINLTGCAVAVVGAGAGAAAASGTDSRGFSTVVSDQTLEHKVNSVLDAQVASGSYTVASYNGHVLLAGQVPNQNAKDKAELAVTNTEGVKKVWNYLTIGKNETIGQITNDTYITSAAKSRLIAQKNVNTNNIKVVTCAGTVYLLGGKDAGDPTQINGAIKGIDEIDDVKKVVNLIKR